jgi:hypothetical protein
MLYKEPNALQIRVALPEIEPPVWRQLIVPWTWHLGQLHLAIQAMFNRWNCHLHEFNIGGLGYGDVEIDEGDFPDGPRLSVRCVCATSPAARARRCLLSATLASFVPARLNTEGVRTIRDVRNPFRKLSVAL